MESWRIVLRDGFIWQWSDDILRQALVLLDADSPKLTQGSTTTPPPLMVVQDWQVEACDLIAFCSTPNIFDGTVGEAEEGFARAVFTSDQTLGEPGASRWFLNAWDDYPRGEIFEEVAKEIRQELQRRVGLAPELKDALNRNPKDTVLKRACYDWVLENGGSPYDALRESGWSHE